MLVFAAPPAGACAAARTRRWSRRHGARARARLRVRLLDLGFFRDRRRDLRRAERELRPGDVLQAARQRCPRRTSSSSTTPPSTGCAGCSASSIPADRRDRRDAPPSPRRRRGAARLQGGPALARRALGRHQRHLKALTGLDASAKDFRTWNATVIAAVSLAVVDRAAPRHERAGSARSAGRSSRSRISSATPRRSRASVLHRPARLRPLPRRERRSSARSRRSARTTARAHGKIERAVRRLLVIA